MSHQVHNDKKSQIGRTKKGKADITEFNIIDNYALPLENCKYFDTKSTMMSLVSNAKSGYENILRKMLNSSARNKDDGIGRLLKKLSASIEKPENVAVNEKYVYLKKKNMLSNIGGKTLLREIEKRTRTDPIIGLEDRYIQAKRARFDIDNTTYSNRSNGKITTTLTDITNNSSDTNPQLNSLFNVLYNGLGNTYRNQDHPCNLHKQMLLENIRNEIDDLGRILTKTKLKNGNGLVASVVTSKMFEDALFVSNVECNRITNTLIFTKECRMPLSFPVYVDGYINEKDNENRETYNTIIS